MNNISPSTPSLSIPQPIQANPTRAELEKEFVEFNKTLQNLEDAAEIFNVEPDTGSEALIKEGREKLAALEKKIWSDFAAHNDSFRNTLEFWRKLAPATLNMNQELISEALKDIQTKSEDLVAAYNMIEGNIDHADTIINLHNRIQAQARVLIAQDMVNNHADKIQTLARDLLKNEQDFYPYLQRFTAQKIVDIRKKFAQAEELPEPPITPHLFIAELETREKIKTVSPQQMSAVVAQTEKFKSMLALKAACQKELCSRAHNLESLFLTDAYPVKSLAEQFMATKKRLDSLHTACTVTNSINELVDTFRSLVLSPPPASPKNELSMPCLDQSPPNISPDPMRISPPSLTSEEEKFPALPVAKAENKSPPSTALEAAPTPTWLLAPLRVFKKHALCLFSRPQKPARAALSTSTTLLPLLTRKEPSALEQFAKRLSKFMLSVVTRSKQERFISINGKDVLEDKEVEGILTAIENFCGSFEMPVNLYPSLLRYLHDNEIRGEIMELFFLNPDPNIFIENLEKKMFMSPADVARFFSIPEELIQADCQSKKPVADSLYLGDHNTLSRLASLGMKDAIKLDNQLKIQELCQQILETWRVISYNHHLLLDALEDDETEIDSFFEFQTSLYTEAQKFDSQVSQLASYIREIRALKPAQNKS
jgi:hypothetical protein